LMRIALAVVALLGALAGCGRGREQPRTVYISIGTDAVSLVRELAARRGEPMQALAASDEIAVVVVEDNELEDIAHLMHDELRRCGGFMLHESVEDALAALRPAPMRGPVDYTLDRAAV